MRNTILTVMIIAFLPATIYSQVTKQPREINKRKIVNILVPSTIGSMTRYAKTTTSNERLIAKSDYRIDTSIYTLVDSSNYVYSGSRASYFSYNYMGYDDNYNLDGSLIFGLTTQTGYSNSNDAPGMLSDNSYDLGPNPLTGDFEVIHTKDDTYDGDNNITTDLEYGVGGATKFENTFTSDLLTESDFSFSEDSVTWQIYEKRSLARDYYGKVTTDSTIIYDPLLGNWFPGYKWSYTYASDSGYLTQALLSTFDLVNYIYGPTERYTITYYTGGHILKTLKTETYDLADSIWISNSLDSFGYTSSIPYFTYLKSYQYNYDGSVFQHTVNTKTIDTYGRPSQLNANIYNGADNTLLSQSRITYTYDDNGYPTSASLYYGVVPFPLSPTPSAVTNYYYEGYSKLTKANTVAASKLKIYPNPTTDQLYITNLPAESASLSLKIANMLSQTVEEITTSDKNVVMSLKDLPTGNYVLTVHDESGQILSTQKISKY